MNVYLPVTEARNKFPRLVEEASKTFAQFIITKNGKPEAILISKEEYDALVDSLEILSNKKSMASLRRAKVDVKAGRMRPLKDIMADLKL